MQLGPHYSRPRRPSPHRVRTRRPSNDTHGISLISTGLSQSNYPYRNQLQELESCDNLKDGQPRVPHHLRTIVTPVILDFWQQELSSHPDKLLVDRILKGLAKGFRIGYRGEEHQLRSAQSNMLSATQHPQIISDYITKEFSTHRLAVAGSPQIADRLGIHVSPLGVIPKKGKDNQWRLIMDLSSPQGHIASIMAFKKNFALSTIHRYLSQPPNSSGQEREHI